MRDGRGGGVLTRRCGAPIADEALLDYWAGDGPVDADASVEAHLFGCDACAARLGQIAALGSGVATLARQGRVAGMITRGLVNRLQRDGVRVRLYAVSPGEAVSCSAYSGDDLLVAALRADVSQVDAVALSMVGPGGSPMGAFDDIPVSPSEPDVFLALPGTLVRQFPSMRLELTLTSAGADRTVLGEYVLEHSAAEPDAQ